MPPSPLLLFLLALALTPVTEAAAGDAAEGERIARRWCSTCHAMGASGSGTDAAPPFSAIARERSPDWVRGFLAHPHARQMPQVEMRVRDIEDIVAYLQTLRPDASRER